MIFINLISNRQFLRFTGQERQGFDGHVVDSVQVDSAGDSQGHPNGPSLGH